MRNLFWAVAILFALGSSATANPVVYDLDKSTSKIEFSYLFGQDKITGHFKNYTVFLKLDFDNTAKSIVDVVLDTTSAKGGFAFATQAMLGEKVLDAGQFPEIKFTSTAFRVDGQKISILGQITIRDVSRPVTLEAQLFRVAGSNPDDRQNLHITMTGTINRHDFGASGYPMVVGRDLTIAIIANISRHP